MDDLVDVLVQLRQTWQALGGDQLELIEQPVLPLADSILSVAVKQQGESRAWLQATSPPQNLALAEAVLQSWANLLSLIVNERQLVTGLTEKLISAWTRLNFLHEITELMATTTDLWQLSAETLRFATQTVEAENAFVAQQQGDVLKFFWIQPAFDEAETRLIIAALQNTLHMLVCSQTQDCGEVALNLPKIHSFIGQQLRVSVGPPSFIGLINQTSRGSFDAGDIQLLESLIELTAAVIDIQALQARQILTEKLNRDLEIAAQIQTSFLPAKLPDIPGYEIAVTLRSAAKVGGDFYDACPSDGKFGFLIGDVSGKGISAALLAADVRAKMRAELEQSSHPGQILQRSNQRLYNEMSHLDHFATVALFCLSAASGQVHYASAGHPSAFWIQAEPLQVEHLPSLTLPLGVFQDMEDVCEMITMQPNDVLVVYTDGLTEVENEQDQLFGMSKLTQVLLATHAAPAQFILDSLIEANMQHRGNAPIVDDLTLLVVKKTSAAAPVALYLARVQWPGHLGVLAQVEAELNLLKPYLPSTEQNDAWLMQMQLAVTEAVSNIIRHAYTHHSGDIRGLIALFPTYLQLDFFDTGQAYEPKRVLPLDFDPDNPPEGGYGLSIIYTAMNSVHYQHLSNGYNHWRLRANLPS